MRRTIAFLLLSCSALPASVVIDRMAVVVGKRVVKTSDIQRDLRLTEFMNREPLNLSAAEMRKSADRLIDQTIIRGEIAKGGYRRPTDADAVNFLKRLTQDRFAGSESKLQAALSHYGLTVTELREQLLWQLTVLRFIDQRFRPGIQVSDEDLHAYYTQHLAELKRHDPKANSFEALQAQLRSTLEGERVNTAFTDWLDQARKRVHVEYREGAFQ